MTRISIDVSVIESSEQLQKLLKESLRFPDFYGNNWDAFWDSITGLVAMPEKFEITGWQHLTKVLPKDAELLLECLNDYNKEPDLKKIELLIN
jgi:RNAse (barnase) inhibitor barstar